MQQKVTIDGKKFGVIIINNMVLMTAKQIAFMHENKSTSILNCYYRNKNEFAKSDSVMIDASTCREHGFEVNSNKQRRLFTRSGYMRICSLIRNNDPVGLEYFDAGQEYINSLAKEMAQEMMDSAIKIFGPAPSEDDEVLDIAVKIVAERQKMKRLEQENAELRERIDRFTAAIKAWL